MRQMLSWFKTPATQKKQSFPQNNIRRAIASLLIYSQFIQLAVAAVAPTTPVKQPTTSINDTIQSNELRTLSLNSQQLGLTGPLSAGATYSNLTGTFFNAQYVLPLGKSFAFGALGEYGANQYRLNGTLGYGFSPLAQMKFTMERLGQRLPFQFDSGNVDTRINQDAYGLRFQKLFNLPFFQGVNAGGYYANAANKFLNSIIFTSNGQNCNAFESGLSCINYRHIAGGKSSGADIGAEILLTPSTLVKGNLYYDDVRYNTLFANTKNQDRDGLGAGVKVNQLLNNHMKLIGEATVREIYDLYQGGLSWLPKTRRLGMELSLMGQHLNSHNATPNNTSVSVQLNVLMDGMKNYDERFNWGNQRISEIAQWIKTPAVHMEQVLAIAEQMTLLLAPTITSISPDSGPLAGGNTITILGRNFATGVLVYIGGMLALIQSVSPTSIQVIAPPSSGNPVVNIVVQNPDGQRTTLNSGYRYINQGQLPVVTSITPNTGGTAGGTPVVIVGANFQGATSVTIGGVPLTNVVVNGTGLIASSAGTQITGITGAHIQTNGLTVVVTTPVGSSSGGPTYTYQVSAPLVGTPVDGSTITDPTPAFTGTGEPGSLVTVTEGGTTLCTATIGSNGSWSCNSSPLTNGAHNIQITQKDTFGTVSPPTNISITINQVAPVAPIIISPVSGATLNQTTVTQNLLITGTGEAGASLNLVFNGVTYTGIVQGDASWSVTIPASAFSSLADGTYILSAVQTNSIGSSPAASQPLNIDTTAPLITLDQVNGTNTINAAQAQNPQEVTGTVSPVAGSTVTVTLNNITYTAIVQLNGAWTATIPSADLLALTDGANQLLAQATSAVGNINSISETVTVNIHNTPTIFINTAFNDDILNIAEAAIDQAITGTTTNVAQGAVVTLTFDSATYTTTVQADGSWSFTLPPAFLQSLADGFYPMVAATVGIDGSTTSNTRTIQVDFTPPTLTLNPVNGTNTINFAQAQLPMIISGTTDAPPPTNAIEVVFSGKSYTANVISDGSWSFVIQPADTNQLVDGANQLVATATDAAGNTTTTSKNVTVIIHNLPTIFMNTAFTDNILNIAEAAVDQLITGTTTNAVAGNIVNLTFAGFTYNATVHADGSWALTLPAANLQSINPDGTYSMGATVTDDVGNMASTAASIEVDLTPPTLTLNPVNGTNSINAEQAAIPQVVSGNGTAGDAIYVNFGNIPTPYFVFAGPNGAWSISIQTADIQILSDGLQILTATETDSVGNTAITNATVIVKKTLPTITMDTVANNDVIDDAAAAAPIVVHGTTNAPDNSQVNITIPGIPGSPFSVSALGGAWSYTIPSGTFTATNNGNTTFSAQVTDEVGNVNSTDRPVTINVS